MASKTLQQLRTLTLDRLRETESDSHFTTDQLNGYLNNGQEYIAAISAPPEDFVGVAIEANIGSYPLPSDNLSISSAYYGTTSTHNDVSPLTIITKTQAKHMFPGWLDAHVDAAGEPKYLILFDQSTVHVYPRPKADQAGKRILMFYGFVPSPMSADGDTPGIRSSYHSILPFFACRLAYYALSDPKMAAAMMTAFLQDYNAIKDNVDKEAEETFAFKWQVTE